jgi:CubicO group peptidase (beta-lactamase class C family)
MKITKRTLLFSLFILVLGIAFLNIKSIHRLYKVVTLYDEDKIVDNFISMHEFFSFTTLNASSSPVSLPVAITDLPVHFEFNSEEITLTDFIEQNRTTGLLVIKDGKIVHEQYRLGFNKDKQHISWSMAKSFISALFGIALDEGRIKSIEQTVTDYVPELKGSGYDNVRIKDVLQMSSGVKFNEDYGDFYSDINRFGRTIALGKSLDEFAATLTREREPGTYHHYVSIDTQVLGMILTRATGVSLTQYLQEKIWDPMGMENDAYWLSDDFGMELALGGLNVSLRDYAKFGMMFLQQGMWQGQQIVPKEWVVDSTTADAPHLQPGADNPLSGSTHGYGFQWWLPVGRDDEFNAQGIYNQFIFIDPDQNLVIANTSANHLYNDKSHQWNAKHMAMFRAISSHFKDSQ